MANWLQWMWDSGSKYCQDLRMIYNTAAMEMEEEQYSHLRHMHYAIKQLVGLRTFNRPSMGFNA